MSPKVCDEFVKIADQLVAQELIKPFISEWCNPVVMVLKGNGSYRLRIDFHNVNETSWYWLFIKDYTKICEPLTRLIKKKPVLLLEQ